MSIDKELLLKPHADTEADVEVPGLGGTVRVRGLTRGQVFAAEKVEGTAYKERKFLAFGMVDPAMTETEVGRWQEASPAGEMEPVADKIRELSGLAKGADKQAVRDFPGEPGSGVRDVPGGQAGDDGGAATGGDG